MRSLLVVSVLSVALMSWATGSASAHGWGQSGFGFPGVFAPAFSYYGNGNHDYQPHWHQTQTPFGSFGWYGNGLHDLLPHQHVQTPFSYQGFSATPFGATQSYYPPSPNYYFAPW